MADGPRAGPGDDGSAVPRASKSTLIRPTPQSTAMAWSGPTTWYRSRSPNRGCSRHSLRYKLYERLDDNANWQHRLLESLVTHVWDYVGERSTPRRDTSGTSTSCAGTCPTSRCAHRAFPTRSMRTTTSSGHVKELHPDARMQRTVVRVLRRDLPPAKGCVPVRRGAGPPRGLARRCDAG